MSAGRIPRPAARGDERPRRPGPGRPWWKVAVEETVRFCLWSCFRLYFHFSVDGRENAPAAGPALVVANHFTYLDPAFVGVPIRPRVSFMAWDRLFRIPVLGRIFRILRAFPVSLDRPGHSSLKTARTLLSSGAILVIFPHGGRADPLNPLPFKPGFASLALDLGMPIHPVTIAGAERIWPRGKRLPRPGRVRVIFHPPIQPPSAADLTSPAAVKSRLAELTRRVEEAVMTPLRGDDSVDKLKGTSLRT